VREASKRHESRLHNHPHSVLHTRRHSAPHGRPRGKLRSWLNSLVAVQLAAQPPSRPGAVSLSTASRSIPILRNLPCFVKRKRAPHAVQPNDYVV